MLLQAARHLRVGHRLGVQPEGGDRGAQPVRQLGDRSALGDQQLAGAFGQPVEGPGELLGLLGALDLGARGQVALAQPVRDVGDLASAAR